MNGSRRPRGFAGVVVVVLAHACGGAPTPTPRPPPPPPPFDADGLAAELDDHLARLAAVVRAHRDDCAPLATALRALFPAMEATLVQSRAAQDHPDHARALTTALRSFDARTRARTTQLEADFTASACTADLDVQDALRAMPTL